MVAYFSKIDLIRTIPLNFIRYHSLLKSKIMMKKIIAYAISILPVAAFAQQVQTFTIKGKIGSYNKPAEVYLAYRLGANKQIDSAQITNGSFQFTGKILNPTGASLLLDHTGAGIAHPDSAADVLPLYIEPGQINITGTDSAATAKITGSKINDDNQKLTAMLSPIMSKAKDLAEEQKTASPAQRNSAEYQNQMEQRYKELQMEQKAALKLFIQQNPDSYLSLLALYSVGGPSPDPEELDSLYAGLSPAIKATEQAKMFKTSLDGLRKTAVGAVAPDFTENDVNGKPVKLSSFRGKYVLLDFWASWCPPCRQENPNVVKAYNRFKEKNFTILSVSLDKAGDKAAWEAAIKNDGLTWTQVSDLKFWDNSAAVLYQVTSIPSNFLIDPSGKIIARDLRGQDLENTLEAVLSK